MIIFTIHGEMDESLLMKREEIIENDSEICHTVEYCLNGCDGVAHRTDIADAVGHFCDKHVSRSVHITKKIGLETSVLEGYFGG